MTSKSKSPLTSLPWTELLAYWVLSFGSHLYSFYQLHRFSKGRINGQILIQRFSELRRKSKDKVISCYYLEHEVGLEREFQLEKGLLKGFKRVSLMLKFLIKRLMQNSFSTDFKCPLKSYGEVTCFFQDPSDFEWSLWTEGAKRSLLWTLIGHGVISRLTSICYPKVGSGFYSITKYTVGRDVLIQ